MIRVGAPKQRLDLTGEADKPLHLIGAQVGAGCMLHVPRFFRDRDAPPAPDGDGFGIHNHVIR